MIRENYPIVPRVELIEAASDQEPVIANLLELYIHDFSEFLDLDIDAKGRFGYPDLPLYWSGSGRHPFLIRADGKLAGLALVKKSSELCDSEAAWDMAEFFILRGFRRRGIGTLAAHQVWRRFPGPWEVRVMQRNALAQQFWAEAISTFAAEVSHPRCIEKDGEAWDLFSFHSRHTIAADSEREDSTR
jgi:predicted acetyltransferase